MQCAFKESMIHQILQFILHFRILPRSSSLREPRGPSLKGVFCLMHFALVTLVSKSRSWCEKKKTEASGVKCKTQLRRTQNRNFENDRIQPKSRTEQTPCSNARPPKIKERGVKSFCVLIVVEMILPQVHLRKPCYDFSFL